MIPFGPEIAVESSLVAPAAALYSLDIAQDGSAISVGIASVEARDRVRVYQRQVDDSSYTLAPV